jgi:hypothetical protein
MKSLQFILLTLCMTFTFNVSKAQRQEIDLSGEWGLRLDEANKGFAENWQQQIFTEKVKLPGSLDENHKGNPNKDTTDQHLSRLYTYTGVVWYQKTIEIPAQWQGKHIELILERTKATKIFIDNQLVGSSNNIFSAQRFVLPASLAPGKHVLTIWVNNDPKLVFVNGSHAYSEDTQTNWNGIIGKIILEASSPTRIGLVKTFPDIENKMVRVQVQLLNLQGAKNLSLSLSAEAFNTNEAITVKPLIYNLKPIYSDTIIELNYPLGEKARMWSEFDPALYHLSVSLLSKKEISDKQLIDFGLRKFSTYGTQFTINGIKTFLRGKHDACVFPLTGYPPTDTASWIRVFRIARSYGINTYRFHTWCPPAAAFEAADIVGMYLQPELPVWWAFDPNDSAQINFLKKEGRNMLDNYANHASFVMFTLGNEIFKERDSLVTLVRYFRTYDGRPLYAQGSNNRGWDPYYAAGDDFWTSFRLGKEQNDLSTDIRTSISFLDSKEGGLLNTVYPNTSFTYTKAITYSPVPAIGHEIGQYQIYPNYDEMKKYTGILRARNFGFFKKQLEKAGMGDQAYDFFRASGAIAVDCYRADIETAIRTRGFGGFHLLDLQDYPGQGTALVGILDAFMDSKGLITPEHFRRFCDQKVLLLSMNKYCWSNNEQFEGNVEMANYASVELSNQTVYWKILNDKTVVASGSFTRENVPQGDVSPFGCIRAGLSSVTKASRLSVVLEIPGTSLTNEYSIWVYPANNQVIVPNSVTVTSELSANVLQKLENGANVLYFPDFDKIKEKSVEGQFIPEFWNWGMFTGFAKQSKGHISPGTMSILCNPEHPIFSVFPTDFRTNWQWWSILKNSRPIILDSTAASYRPVVQVIDNINRNHKLGLILEYKVGKGKLLVCMSKLPAIQDKPEARQLYNSILNYMQSEHFVPKTEIGREELSKIF